MSASAQFRRLAGGEVSGSDRDFDRGARDDVRTRLAGLGVSVHPQDGRGVDGADAVVTSTAVEAHIPDLVRAHELGLPVIHRAAWLASEMRGRTSVAITGTSGKSTVVGMTYAALEAAGVEPGVLTGGELNELTTDDLLGHARLGRGPLVCEADESDKSIVEYAPTVGAVLNLHRDHDEVAAYEGVMDRFVAASDVAVLGPESSLDRWGQGGGGAGSAKMVIRFGFVDDGDDESSTPESEVVSFHGHELRLDGRGSRFRVIATSKHPDVPECNMPGAIEVHVPHPGRHNAENALAALAICHALQVDLKSASRGIANFGGIRRRFEVLGAPNDVEVIDDFAHNPTKIAAAIRAAKLRGDGRLFAVFHPHGYAPTRFFRDELIDVFMTELDSNDVVVLTEIYDAGGSAARDMSAVELIDDLHRRRREAVFVASREDLPHELAHRARRGDRILLMGARDPGLEKTAREVVRAIAHADVP